jgi:hypothetical protein
MVEACYTDEATGPWRYRNIDPSNQQEWAITQDAILLLEKEHSARPPKPVQPQQPGQRHGKTL